MDIYPEQHVDLDEEPDPELNGITNKIIGALIEVHRNLGPGYLEAYYEEAVAIEFRSRAIQYSRQHPFDVCYKEQVIGSGRLDFLVDNKVVLELKACESIAPVHVATVISYLKSTGCRLAIIANFNVKVLKEGLKRIAR